MKTWCLVIEQSGTWLPSTASVVGRACGKHPETDLKKFPAFPGGSNISCLKRLQNSELKVM